VEPQRTLVGSRTAERTGLKLKKYLHYVDARRRQRTRTVLLQVDPEFELAVRRGYTDAGEALTKLIPQVFHLNSELGSAQNRLMRDIGLSTSLWRVLEVVSQASRPLHVASFARAMRVSRQSIQKTVNELKADGYVKLADNPRNRQAKLVLLTEKGLRAFRIGTMRQVPWANRLAGGLGVDAIAALLRTVQILTERLARDAYRPIGVPSRAEPPRRNAVDGKVPVKV